jgi:hypothetical protein
MQGTAIKHILCTWEIGGHLGHIRRLADVMPALHRQGFKLSLAARDISATGPLVDRLNIPVFQSPVWLRPAAPSWPRPISASEILLRFGYANPPGLRCLLHAWRTLFDAVRPDVVLGDYSPTALAAARGMGIPTAALGDGFTLPPPCNPMPAYLPRMAADVCRLQVSDRRIVETYNRAVDSLNLAPIDDAADLWRSDMTFLCTYAALDHYGDRGAPYLGISPCADGVAPNGGSGGATRVLAYLKHGQERPVLDALVRLGWQGDIYAPALPAEQASRYHRHGLHISHQPLSMRDGLQACDLAICHSGHGMVAQTLLAGKPLLLLPLQVEQRLLTHRVLQLGAGILPKCTQDVDHLCAALEELTNNPTYAEQANTFANLNQASPSLADDIAARCWELAA